MTRFLGAAMVTTLAAAAAAGGVSRAAEPRLVRDIDPSTASYGSAPRDLVGLGTRAVFHAEDPTHGRELWASDGTPAGSRRIADICPGPCSTHLQGLWTAGGRWFFHADPDLPGSGGPENPDSPPGRGLWSTDGTAAGTQFLGDLDGLRHLASLEAIGVHLFAASTGPHGREPWRTDGTPEGTRRLADLAPGPADSLGGACFGAAVLGDHVLFAAEAPARGCELWRSDGSPHGTALVRDIQAGEASSFPVDMVAVGDLVVFRALDGVHGDELWRSDGTRAGTSLVTEIVPGAGSAFFASSRGLNLRTVGGHAYFLAGSRAAPSETSGFPLPVLELWRTDGTAGGTRRLTHFESTTAFRRDDFDPDLPFFMVVRFTGVGSKVYFSADGGAHGREPWVSDGTAAGTELLADVCPGPCDSEPVHFRTIGDRGLLFEARDEAEGREIWISDGTGAGTRRAAEICPGECGGFLVEDEALGDRLIYAATSFGVGDAPDRLWVTGGDQATTRLLREWPEVQAFHDQDGLSTFVRVPMAPVGDQVLFAVGDGIHGRELWATAGTPGSTRLLVDLVDRVGAGSQPTFLTRHGPRLYFVADDGDRGFELWTTDGTTAGTRPVLDGPPECPQCLNGFSAPRSIGGLLYYWVDGGADGDRLWRSDGTSAGTFVLAEGRMDGSSFGELGGRVYFPFRDGLWRTDGTAAGTEPVLDGAFSRSPSSFARLGEELFFHAASDTFATVLWKTDGTAAGTRVVSDAIEGTEASHPRSLVELGGRLFFIATAGGDAYDVWETDGTAAGTRRLTDLAAAEGAHQLSILAAVGGRLVVQVFTAAHGFSLWTVDPATGAATLLLDVGPPVSARVVGRSRGTEVLYFHGDDGTHGGELWLTDGTPAGTRLVLDVHAGPATSEPFSFEAAGEALFFTAFEPSRGRQLWRSDGTPGGTFPVTGLDAGLVLPAFAVEGALSALGDELLFAAADVEHGQELWSLPLDAGPAGGGQGEGDPPPPGGPWLETPEVPGFRVKVRIAQGAGGPIPGAAEPGCIPETLCVSGALAGRAEVFVRVVGPKPNGKLWPTLVKFTTSEVEVWIEQLGSGEVRYYRLAGATPGSSDLPGLFDRGGFDP